METNEIDAEDTVGAEDIFGDDLSIRYLVLTCDTLPLISSLYFHCDSSFYLSMHHCNFSSEDEDDKPAKRAVIEDDDSNEGKVQNNPKEYQI